MENNFEEIVKNIKGDLQCPELCGKLVEILPSYNACIRNIVQNLRKAINNEEYDISNKDVEIDIQHLALELLYLIVDGSIPNIQSFANHMSILLNNYANLIQNDYLSSICTCIRRLLDYESNFEVLLVLSNNLLNKQQTINNYFPQAFYLSRDYLKSIDESISEGCDLNEGKNK